MASPDISNTLLLINMRKHVQNQTATFVADLLSKGAFRPSIYRPATLLQARFFRCEHFCDKLFQRNFNIAKHAIISIDRRLGDNCMSGRCIALLTPV